MFKGFVKYRALSRASNVVLMTFDLRQRPNVFDDRQSCVKAPVKSASTPFIRLPKIEV